MFRFSAGFALFVFALSGCNEHSESSGTHDAAASRAEFTFGKIEREGPLQIVATTAMVAEVVQKVAGDLANVEALLGPGTDPHLYTPLRDDVLKLQQADAVFYSGLHLEGRMLYPLNALSRSKPVIGVADRLPKERLILAGPHAVDPHVWFDVELWAETLSVVQEALMRMLPAQANQIQANAQAYRQELAELDAYVRKEMGSIPPERRILITAHDAFTYFGRAYGVEVHGIQGINTESEAGVADIALLVRLVLEKKAPAVFVESAVSDRNIRALIEGCQSAGHPLKLGGELYADAMGPPDSEAKDYAGMVRSNVKTIAAALNAP